MENPFTQSEFDQMYLEALIAEDRERRQAFESHAAERGLVFNEQAGVWADENGNALDDYGSSV